MNEAYAPEGFREAYRSFLQEGRILLTGHSHQAWPDVAREAQLRAYDDAAAHVDDKWSVAVPKVREAVARGISLRLGYGPDEAIAFGQNVHELGYRLLSAFPFDASTRVVTTTGEFHSLERQLRRLQEIGVRVAWVDAAERQNLAPRLIEAITPETSLVVVSAVLFEDAWVVREFPEIAERAAEVGAALLIDAYHAFNVVPLPLAGLPGEVYVVGGGYKYAQFGEGCCFLRVAPGSRREPVQTGWFAAFGELEGERDSRRRVTYDDGAARFAGSTYDATAFYRAQAVLEHWERFGMTVERLRAISLRQTERILSLLGEGRAEAAGFTVVAPEGERRGGFVALRHPRAGALVPALRERGVWVDARASVLRIGPAPYLLDDEIDEGVARILEVAQASR